MYFGRVGGGPEQFRLGAASCKVTFFQRTADCRLPKYTNKPLRCLPFGKNPVYLHVQNTCKTNQ